MQQKHINAVFAFGIIVASVAVAIILVVLNRQIIK
jgi:hypothetical protein